MSVKRTATGLGVLLALLAAVVLGGCGSSDDGDGGGEAKAGGTIQIGLMTDVSGPFVTVGKDVEAAVDLAVEEINAAGGIDGAKLAVKLADTSAQPPQAVTAYRALADDGVVAILGPMSSGEAQVVFKQAPALKVPIMTGTANEAGLTDLGNGWAFRNTATNHDLYAVALPRWRDAYGVETAALVYDEEQPTAAAAAAAVPEVAQAEGVEIVNADDPITFQTGETDFSTVAQRIRGTDADALIILSAPTEGGLLARELARQGERRPVLGNPPQGGASFFEGGGRAIDDWVLPAIFDAGRDDPRTAAYAKAMAARDREPPTIPEAVNYYDGVYAIAEALRGAGVGADTPIDEAREAVRRGILELDGLAGAAGTISFAGRTDAEKTIYVKVVRNGVVEPLD